MRKTARVIVIKDNNLLVMTRDRQGHKFVALPGGAIENDESSEQAAIRETKEECSIAVTNLRLVINEDAGETYGLQDIYLADYVSGEPRLDPNSVEAKSNREGQNLYEPKWLPLADLSKTELLPSELKDMLIVFIETGFPDKPIDLKISSAS